MNQNNTIGLLLGAVIGGVAAYYAIKHQDEIIGKIHDLEDNIHFDHHELINSAKGKLDQLSDTLQSTIQRYTHIGEKDEVAALMEELDRLREEVKALKV